MKRYEGLFIFNTSGKEDSVKEIIDRAEAEIKNAGGRVETVQKMDKRNFSRVADNKYTSGLYVNMIFEAAPAAIEPLRHRFAMSEEVFRVLISLSPNSKPAVPAVPTA